MNEMIDKKAIGKRMLLSRLSKGVKQKVLAKTLGVSHSTLSRIEAGYLLPSVKLLLMFRERFNISIDWILTGKKPTESTGNGLDGDAGEGNEESILFEEMRKDKALRNFILSCYYLYLQEIRKEEITEDDGENIHSLFFESFFKHH
jgi:transcriptional regulator with XRE-family HTH domain